MTKQSGQQSNRKPEKEENEPSSQQAGPTKNLQLKKGRRRLQKEASLKDKESRIPLTWVKPFIMYRKTL